MVVVIVTNVEREVSVDALKCAWAIQTTRTASFDTVLNRAFCKMLDHMPRPAAGDPCLVVSSGLP